MPEQSNQKRGSDRLRQSVYRQFDFEHRKIRREDLDPIFALADESHTKVAALWLSGQPEPDGVTGTILTDADHVADVVATLVKHPRLHFQLYIQVWPDPQVSVQFGTASIVWQQGQPSLDAVTDSE
jgi:hypothetical protein